MSSQNKIEKLEHSSKVRDAFYQRLPLDRIEFTSDQTMP